MSVPKIVTEKSVTVMVAGKTLVATLSHPNNSLIRDYIKAGAPDAAHLAAMFDIPEAIALQTNGAVTIVGNDVFYSGSALDISLTKRMIAMLNEGYNINPLINFLAKLMKNPSNRAVLGLYDFLAATNIPITESGNFLAYKKVRNNYFDIHSGTMRNAVGDVLRIPRNQVDEDPDRTCSHGLHVCSESYLRSFSSHAGNDRVVIVEVDPADVVAIPADYNNAKMRCAGYTVIAEVSPEKAKAVFTAPVMGAASFAAKADSSLSDSYLSSDETDVIRNVEGVVVRFVYDEDEEAWTATWGGEDLDENEDVFYDEDLEDAIESFKGVYMEEVTSWAATVVWLDERGTVHRKDVELIVSDDELYGDEPDHEDFVAEAEDAEDDARVIDVTEGASTWRLIE